MIICGDFWFIRYFNDMQSGSTTWIGPNDIVSPLYDPGMWGFLRAFCCTHTQWGNCGDQRGPIDNFSLIMKPPFSCFRSCPCRIRESLVCLRCMTSLHEYEPFPIKLPGPQGFPPMRSADRQGDYKRSKTAFYLQLVKVLSCVCVFFSPPVNKRVPGRANRARHHLFCNFLMRILCRLHLCVSY